MKTTTVSGRSRKVSKFMTVEGDDKLYLYAADIKARLESMETRHFTMPPETAKPLTKAEALRLGCTLIRFAAGR